MKTLIRNSWKIAPLLLLALSSCSDTVKVSDEDVRVIDFKELKTMQADTKEGITILVDVRQPAKFEAQHIPGAINIFLPKIVTLDSRLTGAKNIVVYANGYTDVLSVAAAKRMIAQHYENVFDFRGGIKEWEHEGGKLEGTTTTTATAPASQPTSN